MEFCSHFEQIADPPNFLRELALKFFFRQKSLKLRHSSNWAANLFKIWQNSNAVLSVAYLFFIIYQKSRVWTITRLKNLRDVYVERYLFSIFVVVKVPKLPINEYKIINQYRLTYALCGGLNHVNYLNIIKRDHVSATVRTRLHLASGWSLDHSGA